jgi:hypothetical protein
VTATVLLTALPVSLAADAPVHLTAFVTHKLVPEPPPEDPQRPFTLAEFPAVADWVATLTGSTLTLTTSVDPARAIPLRVVSDPAADQAAWAACLPATVPVAGFPTPSYSREDWRSLPASRLSDHAIDLHLAAATAAPTRRPGVQGDPVAEAALDTIAQLDRGTALQRLRATQEQRAGRAAAVLRQRTADAVTTIGPLVDFIDREHLQTGPPLPPYQSEITDTPSPIEILLSDTDGEAQLSGQLDNLVAAGGAAGAGPQMQMLLDAHVARRYYERPDEPQQPPRPEPIPHADPNPRPPVPQRDFHQRVGRFGSTPVLLRTLGLAIDIVIDDPDPQALLTGATWIAVTLTPPQEAELTVLPPRRTSVTVQGEAFRAVSSPEWVGGALPLADDTWRVLDLDPDASGLKIDQHLRGLIRRLAIEANGDQATSAPATLRTNGFAIARVERSTVTRARVAAAEQLAADDGMRELLYDDLVRGIRVEVWDDVTKDWHSLHRRRVSVWGTSGETILDDIEDVGFLQLSALNHNPQVNGGPFYIHEVIAGWDGWSLSAPRPGKVIVHIEPPAADGSTEAVVDNPEDANNDASAGGIRTRSRVEPGSLPRLRYGTSYSFRILGVDLAGNIVPQQVVERELSPQDIAEAAEHLDWLRQSYARRDAASLAENLRQPVLEYLQGATRSAAGDGEIADLPDEMRTGDADTDRTLGLMLGLARARTAEREKATFDDFDAIVRATRTLTASGRSLRIRPQVSTDAATFAALAARAGTAQPGAGPAGPELPVRTVTAPRPYLRWDPVPFPALVPRRALGTGEQLARLVVRSGLIDGSSDAQPTSERHVAPPKATELEAEAAGHFDAAMGTGGAAEVTRLYQLALVEAGTFLDRQAPNPDDPNAPLDQPGIALVSRPGADTDHAVQLDDYSRGQPLGEGQYVVHDTDALRLPYLPDPYANGVAMVFYEAGAPHALPEPKVLQSVTIPYPGNWPFLQPLRLVLDRSDDPDARLAARADGHELHVTVPRGESVGVWLSSSMRREDLDRFGMWRSQLASVLVPAPGGGLTQDELAAAEALFRAAANGWTWWLTPSADLLLVHAVPRPVTPPHLVTLRMLMRPAGRGVVALVGVVDLHGPSTERLQLRASWTEQVDDLSTTGPRQVSRSDVVVNSAVGPRERSGVIGLVDFLQPVAGVDLADGTVGLHAAIQKFPDTHHRVITYTPSGTTRYRELFERADVPADDDPSLAGQPVTLDIPSSSRPAGVDVLDTAPLLRWERMVEPAEPFALRSVRRSGVRIWVSRPWYSSGDGELLGVLTFEPYEPDPDHPGQERLKAVQVRDNSTSLWGKDPIVVAGGPVGDLRAATNPPLVPLRELVLAAVNLAPLPIEPTPARPAAVADSVPLVDHAGLPLVRVFGYQPEYDTESRRWFIDIALEDGPALSPFVRLAVARYQPISLPGKALSSVAVTSWVQPLPTRTVTVSRQGPERVQVTVTGTISLLHPFGDVTGDIGPGEDITGDTPTGTAGRAASIVRQSRRVHISLQRLAPGAGDLGWETSYLNEIRAVSVDGSTWKATWTGSLSLPPGSGTPDGDAIGLPPLQTPGSSTTWRVLVEEHEVLDADDPGVSEASMEPVPVERLVYADAVPL